MAASWENLGVVRRCAGNLSKKNSVQGLFPSNPLEAARVFCVELQRVRPRRGLLLANRRSRGGRRTAEEDGPGPAAGLAVGHPAIRQTVGAALRKPQGR